MARARRTPLDLLRATLADVGGPRERARDLGVPQRHGNTDVHALLVTMILGVGVHGPTAIAQLGHLLAEVAGVRLGRANEGGPGGGEALWGAEESL